MPTEQSERLANLVASALECALAERAQFLSDVCGDDVVLREEAESLLRFEERAREFIETPAYEVLPSFFANGVSEAVPAEESVFPSEAEPLTAPEPTFESKTFDPRPEKESILESESTEPLIAQEPFFESALETGTAAELIFETETAEALQEKEASLESEMTEPPIAQAPLPESESTDLISAEKWTYASEPIELIAATELNLEPISGQEPSLENEAAESAPLPGSIFESEPTESTAAQEPIVESEPIELITEEAPIFEIEASEPVIAQKPNLRSEAVIESGPERRKPELEHVGNAKAVAASIPQELKPKPVTPPAKKASDSFEIPAYPPKTPVPSRSAVWGKRAAVISAILLLLAMAVALTSALQEARDARHERDVAEWERSRSERINNYLQRILSLSDQDFTSVWPVPQDRNTTVTEMLDRIAPSVQKELANQLGTRGELLRIIGKAYASQGRHDAAEKNLRAALQTQNAFYGNQNAEVTETLVDLGILLYRREKYPEAEELLEKGATFLRKQNQTLGGRANAVKLAHALDRLGEVKFYRGEVKAGRAVLEEALGVATQAQPDARDRPVLTHIQTDLGGLLVLVGELTNGERLLQESLAESRGAKTPQWETGVTMQMLGELALAKNRPPEAEENFLAAEEIFRKTLGERNLYFARNLERRATVSLIENDLSTAEKLAQRSLALTKECSPNNKLPWTDPMMTLSSIMLRQGRAAEGEDYLRKTIRICEEQPARNYAAIGLAKIRLSQLLLSQDRFTEAENLAFEAHNQAQQHLESEDPMRKATTNNLIEIYEKQQKYKAAREVK